MRATVRFKRITEGRYQIGNFHRLPDSKILWPVRSTVGGDVNESRHLATGREFYRIDLPLGNGAPILDKYNKQNDEEIERLKKQLREETAKYIPEYHDPPTDDSGYRVS